MAFKRALVVDDSRTARQSLAKLLSQHDLEVAFAESGEEALQFLRGELVDVIFMDHTMPGMDGLEAVSAIKNNPRTATIPVMMYTTKEGEVYVSQARALGAVGVLPKQFHPNVLFQMLEKLGLVTDRRADSAEPDDETPRRRISDLADDVEQEYERRALGVSVQTLVTRILEEQHLKLRAEILSGQRSFARQVATEILEHYPGEEETATGVPSARRAPRPLSSVLTGSLAVATLVFGAISWQMVQERNAARTEVARMTTASRNELALMGRRNAGLDQSLRERLVAADAQRRESFGALQWALNHSSTVAFDGTPFDDRAAEALATLLQHLNALDYRGSVSITARLAPFCLTRDASGELQLARPETPVDGCEALGHPLQEVPALSGLQSVAFATVAAEAAEAYGITVHLAARHESASDSARFPPGADRAGAWNRLAADYNRLEFTLDPRSTEVATLR
ncbi:MAG: response regulator [Pseudomonadales bacterium]